MSIKSEVLLFKKKRFFRDSKIILVTGLLVHLYMFVNKYPNHDDLTGMFVNYDQAWAGRWLIKYLMPINTSISLPWVNSVFSILMVAPYQAVWIFAYTYATISLFHDRHKGLSLRRGALGVFVEGVISVRVAHINGVYGVMSTGRLIRTLVADGQNNGQESRVYYSECHSDAPEAVRYIGDSERNVHALLSRLSGLQGYWSSFATKRLCRMLDEFSPDIVHLHVVHGNCLRLSALFNWLHRTGVPVVITLHDCWWFTGRCVHPARYQCTKYTDGCHGCPANNDICPSWFFDRASRMLKNKRKWLDSCSSVRVIAVSDWIAAQAQKSFLKQYPIQRIYNWVDTDIFRPVDTAEIRGRLRLDGKRVVLGVASRWSAEKGLNDFRFFAKELPRDYQVILVGQIEAPLSLPENLLHLPQTNSPQELAQLYSMAEVFVNASRMETFGLTTAEAMACGTPAAVYNTTACPELIGKGTGRTVELSKGAAGLLEAVIALGNSDVSRCRAWAVENFSKQRGCAQYQAVYRSMLGGE